MTQGSRLTGVVDWDGAHFSGVPGADLMHLLCTELREEAGQYVGDFFITEPWTRLDVRDRLDRYFDAVGWAAGEEQSREEQCRVAGIAWWSAAVAGTVARFPERVNDSPWCKANIERPLDFLADKR